MIHEGETFNHKFSYSQEDVDTYAKVSGDTNPLHIDEEYAKNSMFGQRIMHGYLGASVFTKIFGTLFYADGNVYLKQSLQFMKPMYAGKEYEAVLTVKELIKEKGRAVIETKIVDPETGEATTTGEAMILNRKQFMEKA